VVEESEGKLTVSQVPSFFLRGKHSEPDPGTIDDLLSNEIGETLVQKRGSGTEMSARSLRRHPGLEELTSW
jgi:hypothetical protein